MHHNLTGFAFVFSNCTTTIIYKYNTVDPGLSPSYQLLASGFSSPSVFDSTLYIGSSTYLYSYADSIPSTYKWRFEASSPVSSSSPTADSDHVYIGSENGTLYAVNDSDGVKAWEYPTDNNGFIVAAITSPVLANGVVYYATISGLYAVNAATGKLLWHTSDGGAIYASPCVSDKNGATYHSSISGIKN